MTDTENVLVKIRLFYFVVACLFWLVYGFLVNYAANYVSWSKLYQIVLSAQIISAIYYLIVFYTNMDDVV